jgi:hypothetical protein
MRSCSRGPSRLLKASPVSTCAYRMRLVVRTPCGLAGKRIEQARQGYIDDQSLTGTITLFALGLVGT